MSFSVQMLQSDWDAHEVEVEVEGGLSALITTLEYVVLEAIMSFAYTKNKVQL